MAPEVFFSVCYGMADPPKVIQDLHTFTPAILYDHCRHRVKYADYPAVVPEEGHRVRGIYVTGLTDANIVKLDYFEGSEYLRKMTTVKLLKTEDGKEEEYASEQTSVYIFIQPDALEKGEWDFQEFRRDKMKYWSRGEWRLDQGTSTKLVY
jgi:hypothetical protein